MASLSVSPISVTFAPTYVSQLVALYSTPSTQTFTVTNTTSSSIILTGILFSEAGGDAVTVPQLYVPSSDFIVTLTSGSFPITLTAGSNQSFTVAYNPKPSSSGTDIRNVNVNILNNGKFPCVCNLGGGVIQTSMNTPQSHPIMGLPSAFNLSDMDTVAHYSPMLFFAAPVTGSQSETSYIAPSAATYTTGSSTVPYALKSPYVNGSPKGGRSYQILVFWTDDTVTMNIVIKAIAGSHVIVGTFTGITYNNAAGLYIGNSTGFDLQGLELTCTTTVTAGSSAYNIGAVITG